MMKMKAIYRIAAIFAGCISINACHLPTAGSGTLSGVVTDASGLPLEGASVVYGDSAVYTASTGAYIYEGLPDGLQGVWFRMDGYYSIMRQVGIPDGGTATCDVSLEIITAGWAAGAEDSGYGTILHSRDAGKSWVRQGTPAMIPGVRLTDVCAVDDMTCWIVGDADTARKQTVILKTEDGGAGWTNQGGSVSGLRPVMLSAVWAFDKDTAWAVCSDTCVVLKTENGGSSWRICRESPAVLSYSAVTSLNGRELWCCGTAADGGTVVEYSPDGGDTWSSMTVSAAYQSQAPADICAVPGPVLYLTGTGMMGVLASHDGGLSWTPVLNSDADLLTLEACGTDAVWAAGSGGRLYVTNDAFATRQELYPVSENYSEGRISSVSFLRDAVTGALSAISGTGATGAVYYTEDGGMTWSASSVPFEFSIESIDFVGGSN